MGELFSHWLTTKLLLCVMLSVFMVAAGVLILSIPIPIPIQVGLKNPNTSTNSVLQILTNNSSLPILHSRFIHHKIKEKQGYLGKIRKLQVLEAHLAQARAIIRQSKYSNQIYDDDFVPKGLMYNHPKTFHRSYLEMEKRFKVYVYKEGDPPIFHYGPNKQTMGIEGYFIQQMETSNFRTSNPYKAHVFFLPFNIDIASHYVNVISHKYPFWNRSLGADHVILACHDRGPEILFSIPYVYKNSIRTLCNANTSEKFNPTKDVSIPEILLPSGNLDGLLGSQPPSERSVLVSYIGGIHGPIRPSLFEHWEDKDKDVQIQQYLPKNISYYGMMRKSKYCICPSGTDVASPLYMGCVPVLIKDGYVMPFSDVLNWKSFSIIISVEDFSNLKMILEGISQTEYIKMQRRGAQVKRHFEINWPPKRYDVFHMILHSIWLRRINVRIN